MSRLIDFLSCTISSISREMRYLMFFSCIIRNHFSFSYIFRHSFAASHCHREKFVLSPFFFSLSCSSHTNNANELYSEKWGGSERNHLEAFERERKKEKFFICAEKNEKSVNFQHRGIVFSVLLKLFGCLKNIWYLRGEEKYGIKCNRLRRNLKKF